MKFDKHKKKTLSNYWNNFSVISKDAFLKKSYIFNLNKFLYNLFGFKISIKIVKQKQFEDDAFKSLQTNQEIINYRNKSLSKIILIYLKKFQINSSELEIITYIKKFDEIFRASPIKDLNSGFGFNEGLILFCLLKKINPSLVIESGVMRGFTTYIIDKGTSSDCNILCYDINFNNLVFKSDKATYHNYDISSNPPKIKTHKAFAFWDDHTNHLDRLKFSLKNNINFNVFDDDLSFLNFHSDGWPPIPSITMLQEINNKVINNDEIEWISKNRQGKIWLTKFKHDKNIKKIKYHFIFPELFLFSGYKNHSNCSFVKIK